MYSVFIPSQIVFYKYTTFIVYLQGKNAHMHYWQRCEVEIGGLKPAFCEPYFDKPNMQNLSDAIDLTIDAMKKNEAQFAGNALYYFILIYLGHVTESSHSSSVS